MKIFMLNESTVCAVSQKEPRAKKNTEKALKFEVKLEAPELILTPYEFAE